MSKILIIEDDNLIEKFLNEISTEISVADITKIHKIDKTENSDIINYKNITLNKENYEVIQNGTKVFLTAKEFEILKSFMESPHKVFSRNNLLNSVWSYDYFGDEKIVNTHIKNIRKKLGNDIIETVRGAGYKLK